MFENKCFYIGIKWLELGTQWVKQCHKPPMAGNGIDRKNYMMVYDIAKNPQGFCFFGLTNGINQWDARHWIEKGQLRPKMTFLTLHPN